MPVVDKNNGKFHKTLIPSVYYNALNLIPQRQIGYSAITVLSSPVAQHNTTTRNV